MKISGCTIVITITFNDVRVTINMSIIMKTMRVIKKARTIRRMKSLVRIQGTVMSIMTNILRMSIITSIMMRMMRVIQIAKAIRRMNILRMMRKTIGHGFAHQTTSEILDIAYKARKIFEIIMT